MKRRTLLIILVSWLFTSLSIASDNKHVIVIGIDGMGGRYLKNAYTPNLDFMKINGSYTFTMQNALPPKSSPCWMSMICGSPPSAHGVLDNTWQPGDSTPPPTIFKLIKNQYPDSKVVALYDWSDFGRLIESDATDLSLALDNEEQATNHAMDIIKKTKPNFLFIQLDHVDGAGHDFGFGSLEYSRAITKADFLIGKIISAVEDAGIINNTYIIVTADHGGYDQDHILDNIETRSIPWFIMGPDIIKNKLIHSDTRIWETAATIAYIFELVIPDSWSAGPIKEVFKNHKVDFTKPNKLKFKYVNNYQFVYSDSETGAIYDLSVWSPQLPFGYVRLGQVAHGSHDMPTHKTLVIKDDLVVLTYPLWYEKIADDKESGGKYDVTYWRPIPPRGFTCLGDVVQQGYHNPPPLDYIRCIKSTYTVKARGEAIWTDHQSEGIYDITVWRTLPDLKGNLSPNTILIRQHHGSFGHNLFINLKYDLFEEE